MIIIFDLDYTLLDTEKFKKGLVKVLGLTLEQFNLDYKKYFSEEKPGYTPQKHLRILKREKRISSVFGYEKKINAFLKKTDTYLFRTSLSVIKKLSKKNKLILISYGNKSWQRKKIENAKIKKYFYKIVLVNKPKHLALDFLKNPSKAKARKKENILIINDNASESLKMKKAIGRCELCIIRGPYSRNVKHNLKIHNIKDCVKLYD